MLSQGQDAMQSFIADDDEVDEIMEDDSGDESDEDSDLFDSVCAICDNGGDLLWYAFFIPHFSSFIFVLVHVWLNYADP